MNSQFFHSRENNSIIYILLNVVLTLTIMAGCVNTQLCTINNTSEWMISDSIVIEHLGDSISQTIFNPDLVKCYHLSCKDSIDKENDILVVDGYIRDSLITTLNISQISVLQYILPLNSRNYLTDTLLVQSPYLPNLEFEFMKQDCLPVSIVVSTLDYSWQISKEGKLQISHNYTETKAVERFCNYFLDIYFQKVQ